MRIALTHCEEITKLLEQHDKNVQTMHAETEFVAKTVVPGAQGTEAPKEEEEEDDVAEPCILNVLNEDLNLALYHIV
jgi:hypothetical protein